MTMIPDAPPRSVPVLARLLHSPTPMQGDITSAEAIILRLHRRLREAETDMYAFHRLLAWHRLQEFVDDVLAGREIEATDADKAMAWSVAAWLQADAGEPVPERPAANKKPRP